MRPPCRPFPTLSVVVLSLCCHLQRASCCCCCVAIQYSSGYGSHREPREILGFSCGIRVSISSAEVSEAPSVFQISNTPPSPLPGYVRGPCSASAQQPWTCWTCWTCWTDLPPPSPRAAHLFPFLRTLLQQASSGAPAPIGCCSPSGRRVTNALAAVYRCIPMHAKRWRRPTPLRLYESYTAVMEIRI